MSRMPLLAAAAVGGRRRLVDLCATPPSPYNWQEPLGQSPIPPWSHWSGETKAQVLFFCCSLGFVIICCAILRFFCRNKDSDHDISRFVIGNTDNAEGISSLPPPLQEEQPLPASGEGLGPLSNSGEEGDQMPAADMEMALGDVQLTQVGVEWMLAHMEMLAQAEDMDIAPAAEEEIVPAQEPGPTLKCTYRTADGWTEGTCSVCLSELVDGEKVRVLTACMHCFHAACIEEWLRRNRDATPTCPLCRAPVMILPARRHRRRQSRA